MSQLFKVFYNFYISFLQTSELDRSFMTFVSLALSKDTTYFYTAGSRETRWRTLICLRNAPSFRSKPRCANHCTTTPSFKILKQKEGHVIKTFSGCLPKSRTENIITINLCQYVYFSLPGQDKVKQNNTNKTHVRVIYGDIQTTKTSTIKTCLSAILVQELVCYPLYKRYVMFSS